MIRFLTHGKGILWLYHRLLQMRQKFGNRHNSNHRCRNNFLHLHQQRIPHYYETGVSSMAHGRSQTSSRVLVGIALRDLQICHWWYPRIYAELEALIWVMTCMTVHNRREVAFATDCSELVKMMSAPLEWPTFVIHLDEFTRSKEWFSSFSLSHIPRSCNLKTDWLGCSARLYPHDISYVGSIPPV